MSQSTEAAWPGAAGSIDANARRLGFVRVASSKKVDKLEPLQKVSKVELLLGVCVCFF